ncbi:Tetratricopeptide repeat-containing protein [Marinobacter sp. es.048]|uniref:tetratricopeptide repeat protein n=1 Tax=Marinobacter sp. es.048 TaxID=1761795 RepID=UPI000B597FE0|nr:tetratricopeptide repeat protein [Marinobacter sp. es.048]SNC60481.1 Tetratricopeptide repeat-containing protein [Marinobacter sp. es.048]
MKRVLLMVLCLTAQPLWAAPLETELVDIQHRWAEIQYQVPEGEQEKAFEGLAREAEQFVAHYPNRAEPLIWQGIVLSTYAGAKGGLGALGLVKEARKSLEAAMAIDPDALDGSAYTSLGSLYYQVPGWPLGFGDDDKARQYLQKALAINPDGMDANFFFGDFLLDQGEPERARSYLKNVLEAPGRAGRDVADAGRRAEARGRLKAL